MLEKLLFSIILFLLSFNISSTSQFGFRKGYSTSHEIFNIQQQINNCFNKPILAL